MFSSWDADKGGSIDMAELEAALMSLHEQFVKKYGKKGWTIDIAAKVESLRSRAAAGKVAVRATQQAAAYASELEELVRDLESRIEVQLGMIIIARTMRQGPLTHI